MRNLLWIVLALLGFQAKGQTVEKLQDTLKYYDSYDPDAVKFARLLHKKDPLNDIGIEYMVDYYKTSNIDSTHYLFDRLIDLFPEKAQAYYLKALYLNYSENEKLNLLQKAQQLDNTNVAIKYQIAKLCYKDYLIPTFKHDFSGYGDSLTEANMKEKYGVVINRKQAIANSGAIALEHFYKLWDIDQDSRDILFFPIRQLEISLKAKSKYYKYKNVKKRFSPQVIL